jgi:hypothetical protein
MVNDTHQNAVQVQTREYHNAESHQDKEHLAILPRRLVWLEHEVIGSGNHLNVHGLVHRERAA